jgi:S-DNA-T family DNA segregation ATPase FtsK/SpoIIIE
MTTLIPDTEEARLLGLLNTEWWKKHSPNPILKNLTIDEARLTSSGIIVRFSLGERVTQEKVTPLLPFARRMLDIRDQHETRLQPGGRASQLALRILTRRVTDTMNMLWRPGITSFGVDTLTGEEVSLPLHRQIQVAGAKGSGKSWTLRPLMCQGMLNPNYELSYIDPKMVEGAALRGLIPVATSPEAALDLIGGSHDDMFQRAAWMERKKVTVWTPSMGPYKILVVDEGRDLLATIAMEDARMRKAAKQADEEVEPENLFKLSRISSMGRAWGYFVWWATQYPIVSGSSKGIDSLIDANADYRFCLRVGKPKHSEVALGADADYGPHLIPPGDRMRGHGYLGGHGPNLIRPWTVTDEMLAEMKEVPLKDRDEVTVSSPVVLPVEQMDSTPEQKPVEELVQDSPSDPDTVDLSPNEPDRLVFDALVGERSLEDLVVTTGLSHQHMLATLAGLAAEGRVLCRLTPSGFLYRKP